MSRSQSDVAYLLLSEGQVPDRWRRRAMTVLLVPLLPEEAASVLATNQAPMALTPLEEDLVRLVSSGRPISAIAREQGEPLRTVQRRVAALRDRLGVSTTQELVAELARRGFADGADAPEG